MNKKTSIDPHEVAKFAELTSEWWDKDGAFKTLHDINPVRLAFVKQYCDIAGKRVLDVGCGGGIFSEGLAKMHAKVTAIDVESSAISKASIHAQEEQLSIRYVCQALEDCQSKPFSVITCMEMLEHVSDPRFVLEHCARLLKPGGFLFLSTINRTMEAYLQVILAAEYLLSLLPRQTHDYQKFIKPSELAAMLRTYHLEIIGLSGMSYNPLLRKATLQTSVQVNYLLACRKKE